MPLRLPPGISLRPAAALRNLVQAVADVITLRLRAKSGQTQPLQTWEDASGNEMIGVTPAGVLRFGQATTPGISTNIDLAGTTADGATTVEQYARYMDRTTSGVGHFTVGFRSVVEADMPVTGFANYLRALDLQAHNVNAGTVQDCVAIFCDVGATQGTGTINNAVACDVNFDHAAGSVIQFAYGLRLNQPFPSPANKYRIFCVYDVSNGCIYSGDNSLGTANAKFEVRNTLTAADIVAIIRGAASQTGDLLQLQDGSGNNMLAIPAAGDLKWQRLSSTNTARQVASLLLSFAVSTDATYQGRGQLFARAFDGVDREFCRWESDGTQAKAGFLGAAAVARQSVGAAATDAATTQTLANNLRQALINLGLCQT